MKYFLLISFLLFSSFACSEKDEMEQFNIIAEEILYKNPNLIETLGSIPQVDISDLLNYIRLDSNKSDKSRYNMISPPWDLCTFDIYTYKLGHTDKLIYRISFVCHNRYNFIVGDNGGSNRVCFQSLTFIKEIVDNKPKYCLFNIGDWDFQQWKFKQYADEIIEEIEQLKASNFNFSDYQLKGRSLNCKTIIDSLNTNTNQKEDFTSFLTEAKKTKYKISGWYSSDSYNHGIYIPEIVVYYHLADKVSYYFHIDIGNCFSSQQKFEYSLTKIERRLNRNW